MNNLLAHWCGVYLSVLSNSVIQNKGERERKRESMSEGWQTNEIIRFINPFGSVEERCPQLAARTARDPLFMVPSSWLAAPIGTLLLGLNSIYQATSQQEPLSRANDSPSFAIWSMISRPSGCTTAKDLALSGGHCHTTINLNLRVKFNSTSSQQCYKKRKQSERER